MKALIILLLTATLAHGQYDARTADYLRAWRIGAAVDSAWTPADIEGLALWLDASDLSTLSVTNVSGVNRVTEWRDKSGNGYHALPHDGLDSNRPASGTRTLNGLNVVDFNLEQMNISANYNLRLNNVASLGVHKFDSFTSGVQDFAYKSRSSGGGNTRWRPGTIGSGGTLAYLVNVGTGGTLFNQPDRFMVRLYALRHVSNLVTWRTEGTERGTESRTVSTTITAHTLGMPNSFDGMVAELINYDRGITDAEIQKVEGYLAHKWGLTGDLPSDHPYKDNPPTK